MPEGNIPKHTLLYTSGSLYLESRHDSGVILDFWRIILKWSVVTVIILTKLSGIDLMRKLIVVSLSLVKLAIFEIKPKDCFLRDRETRFLIFLYSGISLGLYSNDTQYRGSRTRLCIEHMCIACGYNFLPVSQTFLYFIIGSVLIQFGVIKGRR